MSNTTTTLNPGSGGDTMDESLVTQSDGTTTAKRPRVVPGGDDGTVQTFESDGHVTAAHVHDPELTAVLYQLCHEQRRTNALLKLLLVSVADDLPTDNEIEALT